METQVSHRSEDGLRFLPESTLIQRPKATRGCPVKPSTHHGPVQVNVLLYVRKRCHHPAAGVQSAQLNVWGIPTDWLCLEPLARPIPYLESCFLWPRVGHTFPFLRQFALTAHRHSGSYHQRDCRSGNILVSPHMFRGRTSGAHVFRRMARFSNSF
jgi:hypothetical protein